MVCNNNEGKHPWSSPVLPWRRLSSSSNEPCWYLQTGSLTSWTTRTVARRSRPYFINVLLLQFWNNGFHDNYQTGWNTLFSHGSTVYPAAYGRPQLLLAAIFASAVADLRTWAASDLEHKPCSQKLSSRQTEKFSAVYYHLSFQTRMSSLFIIISW